MNEMVSLCRTDSYAPEQMQQAVARHFKALAVSIDPNAKVVLKPNLIMRCTPARAATTHPALVEAVIYELQKSGVQHITIADSPGGGYTPQLLAANYEQSGMKAVAERCGVTLNLNCGSKTIPVENSVLCHRFDIIDPIVDADVVINLCKLKTHCMTTLSCGVKNLFGCIPGLLKPQLHYRFPDGAHFAQMLVDLSLLVRPTLTLVDAVDAMEGDGPTGGKPRHLGFTAASNNIYALDLVMAHLIGLSATQVPTLAEQVRRGLCPSNAAQVEQVGDPIPPTQDFLMPASKKLDFTGNLPKPLAWVVGHFREQLAPRPRVRKTGCIGCGRCAESCPVQTIVLEDKKAKIVPEPCIRCFCCHEMCPVQAIEIYEFPLFRLFSK